VCVVEQDLGHAREDGKREYNHKRSQLLKPKHKTLSQKMAQLLRFYRSGLG
jgi:hypothetical protein